MKYPTIYILTMGRPHKQLTYNLLPDFLKEKVVFVIRDFEVEFFKDKNYKVCPEWVTNVSTTRKFIQHIAGDSYHWVLDDDITQMMHRPFDPDSPTPWKYDVDCPDMWQKLCKDIKDKIDEGFGMIGFTTKGRIPSSSRYPFKEGLCGTQWFCMNGKLLKNVKWDDINLSDDYDGIMQAISQGVRVLRFEKWVLNSDKFGAEGGCKSDRSIERHNTSMNALMQKWPKYFKPCTPGKNVAKQSHYGVEMIRLKSFFAQAYKDYKHMRT